MEGGVDGGLRLPIARFFLVPTIPKLWCRILTLCSLSNGIKLALLVDSLPPLVLEATSAARPLLILDHLLSLSRSQSPEV